MVSDLVHSLQMRTEIQRQVSLLQTTSTYPSQAPFPIWFFSITLSTLDIPSVFLIDVSLYLISNVDLRRQECGAQGTSCILTDSS